MNIHKVHPEKTIRYEASILIPVFNDAEELETVLAGLGHQTVDPSLYEIIVIDNGSDDHIRQVVASFDGVRYLQEIEHLESPYSSRNRGIETSSGDIIVLLDSTCKPERDWLEKGLHCMKDQKADIVSSNVKFDFRGEVTAGKVYDSNNMSSEFSVNENGVAKTASLFVRRELFDRVGFFPEGVRSGADVRWVSAATKAGAKLVFCNKSVAWKKARTWSESIKKQWRVGKGQPAIWRDKKESVNLFKKLVSHLIPYHPRRVTKLAADKGVNVSKAVKVRLYFFTYFIRVLMAAANIYGEWILPNDNGFTPTGRPGRKKASSYH